MRLRSHEEEDIPNVGVTPRHGVACSTGSPFLKADALKFVTTFRSQIPKDMLQVRVAYAPVGHPLLSGPSPKRRGAVEHYAAAARANRGAS
jgi:hypothetical protein